MYLSGSIHIYAVIMIHTKCNNNLFPDREIQIDLIFRK